MNENTYYMRVELNHGMKYSDKLYSNCIDDLLHKARYSFDGYRVATIYRTDDNSVIKNWKPRKNLSRY